MALFIAFCKTWTPTTLKCFQSCCKNQCTSLALLSVERHEIEEINFNYVIRLYIVVSEELQILLILIIFLLQKTNIMKGDLIIKQGNTVKISFWALNVRRPKQEVEIVFLARMQNGHPQGKRISLIINFHSPILGIGELLIQFGLYYMHRRTWRKCLGKDKCWLIKVWETLN